MRSIAILATLAATPAFAHGGAVVHPHTDWTLIAALALFGLAAVLAAGYAWTRGRK